MIAKNEFLQHLKYPIFACAKIAGKKEWYYLQTEQAHRRTKSFDIDEYNTQINPYKLLWVSPEDILKVTRRPLPAVTAKPDLFGRVKEGDWDRRRKITVREEYETNNPNYKKAAKVRHGCTTINDTVLYRSFKKHFDEGTPWKDTGLYQWYDSGIYKPHKYKSKIDKLFEKYDQIYKDIATEGYKTQREIGTKPFPWDRYEEIIVDIGRDGELLLVNGRHRLSIAKILGLLKVPVVVSVRHKQWMEFLDEMKDTDNMIQHEDIEEQNLHISNEN